MGKLGSAGADLSKALDGMGKVIAGIGAAAAVPIGLAAKSAIEFGGEMANVNSILKLSDAEIASLGDQIQGLSADVNKGPVELASALYDIASSGFTGAEGLDVLTAAANAANAGLTSTETAGRAISSVLNAYGLEASEAGRVSDVLFQTVNDGVITFDQLANNMGNTLPLASSLGISVEELGAAYANMTLQGVNASAAETQIAALMRAALNPTDELTAAVQAYGFESAEALIAAEGFPGLLKAIDQGAGGSKEALFGMLGTQEAMNAALILADENASKYVDELGRMDSASDGAGATQEALEKQMKSASFQMERAGVAAEAAQVALGEKLEPAIAGIANAVGDFGFLMAELPGPVLEFAAAFGAVVAVLGVGGGAALIAAGKIVEMSNALAAAGINVGKFAAALGLVGLAIGAGILAYQTNFLGFADIVDATLNKAGAAIDKFAKVFERAFANKQAKGLNDIASAVGAFGKALKAAFGIDLVDQFNGLAQAIDAFGDAFTFATENGFNPAATALHVLAETAEALGLDGVADALHSASEAAQVFGNTFEQAFATEQQQRLSGLSAAIAAFGTAFSNLIGVDVTGFFDEIANTIDIFAAGFNAAVADGINPFQAALLGLRDVLSSIVGFDLAPIFDRVGDALGSASLSLSDFIRTLQTGDILGAFQGLATDIAGALGGVKDALVAQLGQIDFGQIASDVGSGIRNALNSIAGLLGDVNWDAVKTTIQQGLEAALTLIGDNLGPVAEGIAEGIKTKLGEVGGLIGDIDWEQVRSTIATTLHTALSAIGNNLGPVAEAVATAVKTKLGEVGTFLSDVDWESVKSNIGTTLSNALTTIGDTLGPIAENIATAIETKLGEVGGLLSDIDWAGVAEAISTSLTKHLAGADVVIGDIAGFLAGIDSSIAEAIGIDASDYPAIEAKGRELGGNLGSMLGEAIAAGMSGGGDGGAGGISIQGGGEQASAVEAAFKFADAFAQQFVAEIARGLGGENIAKILEAEDPFAAMRTAIHDWFQTNVTDMDLSFLTAELDLSAISTGIQEALQSISDSIFEAFNTFAQSFAANSMGGPGERGEAGTMGGGLSSMFSNFATNFINSVGLGIESVIEQIKAGLESKKTDLWNGIKDALFGIFSFATGLEDAKASGEEAVDPAALGKEMGSSLGEAFQSPEFVSGVEEGMASIPASTFSSVAVAFLSKLQEGISEAMLARGPGAASETGEGTSPLGADMGKNIITSLVTGLTDSLQSAQIDPALFTGIGTALMEKIQAGISAALSTGANSLGGPGERGESGTASGLGASIVTSLATSLASAITAAPPESFAAVGTAIQAKLSEVLATALSGGGAQGGRPGGAAGAVGGASGIGEAIAQMIATAVTGADFGAVGTALQTALVVPVQEGITQLTTTLTTGVTSAIQAAMSVATQAVTIGTTIVTSAVAGIGGGSAPPGGVGPVAPTGGGTGLDGAVTGIVTAAIAAGTAAAAGASAIGTAIVANAAAGVGGGSGGAVPSPGLGGGSAPGGTGGSLDGAVTAMVAAAIAAGVAAAAGASAIGAAISAGAAAGVILTAMNSAVETMVNNGIAAGMSAAEAASPSRKAERDLGEPVAEGAAIGVDNKAAMMADSVASMMDGAIQTGADILESGSALWEAVAEKLGINVSSKIAGGMEAGQTSIMDAGKALTETISKQVNDRLAAQAHARSTWLPQSESMFSQRNSWAQGLMDRGRDRLPETIEVTSVLEDEALGRVILGKTLVPLMQSGQRGGSAGKRRWE